LRFVAAIGARSTIEFEFGDEVMRVSAGSDAATLRAVLHAAKAWRDRSVGHGAGGDGIRGLPQRVDRLAALVRESLGFGAACRIRPDAGKGNARGKPVLQLRGRTSDTLARRSGQPAQRRRGVAMQRCE
jgi:hypothetical protein